MPWCPKCKTEFQEGISVCSDCKIPLVDELDVSDSYVELLGSEKELLISKFSKYLTYSKIKNIIKEDPEKGFVIFCEPGKEKKAKAAFAAFLSVETELHKKAVESGEPDENDIFADEDMQDVPSEGDEDEFGETLIDDENDEAAEAANDPRNTTIFVKQSDKSKEYKSTAVTFILFGILLAVLFVLNITKTMTLFGNPLSLGVIGALTVIFIGVGISSNIRARKALEAAGKEDELIESVNNWLKENITEEVLSTVRNPELSPEVNYLKETEYIKTNLEANFEGLDENFVYSIIEDYYNEYIEPVKENN